MVLVVAPIRPPLSACCQTCTTRDTGVARCRNSVFSHPTTEVPLAIAPIGPPVVPATPCCLSVVMAIDQRLLSLLVFTIVVVV
ncbi:hypothetical protein GUJ93_ZPchr0001g31350 [Zizania palustris]|uniref:Uncharacterized protein n=1 Tax=Zizania palustris TaxID=103762 RepID=A0A8J5V2N2_ZIZPA|nr:hypothetical protein GUJ93_ZPchr0001g31350 [Zizania palustris]